VWWGTNAYKITYTFQLSDSQGCCIAPANASPVHSDLPARGVKQLGNHLTVFDQRVCICDPAGEVGKKSVRFDLSIIGDVAVLDARNSRFLA